MIVLPELVTSGYCFESAAEATACALPADDPVFEHWHRLAPNAVIVAGFAERGEAGRLYNSAVLIDADGRRALYRKLHLWDREQRFFTPGDRPPPVVDTSAGRIGVAVCYDIEFPELTRDVALAGAQLLAVPTNWPLVPRPSVEHPPEVVIAMAAARVNRMAVACCDRTGTERGQEWTGGTTVIGTDGWPVASADPDGVASALLDLGAADDKRVSARNDLLRDRRMDVYGAPRRYSPSDGGDERSAP